MSPETLTQQTTLVCHEFFDGFVPHTPRTEDFLAKRAKETLEFMERVRDGNNNRYTTNPTLAKLYEILAEKNQTPE